jgi:hypothetical protein
MLVKHSGFYDQIFGGIELIITDSYSQRKMEEEGIHDFRIYSGNGLKFETGEIDSFCKIDLMVKGIKKRCLEGIRLKGISGEIERLESFHFLGNNKVNLSRRYQLWLGNQVYVRHNKNLIYLGREDFYDVELMPIR